jgi:hypothetical protein
MTDYADQIDCIALDLIERFGDLAASIASELAAFSDQPVHFVLCAPFSNPLVVTWPFITRWHRCRMQCDYEDTDNIEGPALKAIKLFGSDAVHISCKLVEIVEGRQHDPHMAQTWRDIANAIERLRPKPR